MSVTNESSQFKVLHILTLNGRNGEYGGPVRVAREICTELNLRGHSTHIFSGALKGSEPTQKDGLSESFILVKPILRKYPVSTLWNWRLLVPLIKHIKTSEIVHIHFARDLIPYVAAFLSILFRKPFVTQTHGMIIPDFRLGARFIDFMITRRLIEYSHSTLVLTDTELSSVLALGIKSPCTILPNGIAVDFNFNEKHKSKNRIAFCSRLEKRKEIGRYIQLAEVFRDAGITFEIYGPDGGELGFVQSELEIKNLHGLIEYKGSLQADEVQNILAEIDLLVLPSTDEPYPMVILESLAVGTPVLVMPSCGFSEKLRKFEPSFVAGAEDLAGLCGSLNIQISSSFFNKSQLEIMNFCAQEFGIKSVVDKLLVKYKEAVSHEK